MVPASLSARGDDGASVADPVATPALGWTGVGRPILGRPRLG